MEANHSVPKPALRWHALISGAAVGAGSLAFIAALEGEAPHADVRLGIVLSALMFAAALTAGRMLPASTSRLAVAVQTINYVFWPYIALMSCAGPEMRDAFRTEWFAFFATSGLVFVGLRTGMRSPTKAPAPRLRYER